MTQPACAKQALQAQLLASLVEQRLRAVPMLRDAIAQDPSFTLRIAVPRLHERDVRGRNWDIVAFQTGFMHWPQGQAEFRAIVNDLRTTYDLA
ncbi:hypothetical protein [Caldimonas sp. KR1-144]|uniref:hypothetical protein n=1 Tax=Caldimonas sp. KR1-144 TaxID=3400911 RepID=UPI003C0E57EF